MANITNITTSVVTTASGKSLPEMDPMTIMMMGIFGLIFAFMFFKFLVNLLKKPHLDYMKNMRDRFIGDCMANCPNDVGELGSSYLSLSFGKIVGWLPKGVATKEHTKTIIDPTTGKPKKIKIGAVPNKVKEDMKKSKGKVDIKTCHFFAIIQEWKPVRWWIFSIYKFPILGKRINEWWNYKKEIKLVVVPHDMLADAYKLKGNILVKTYALATTFGGLLTPSDLTIDHADFKKFVDHEYLETMKEDILEKVGDTVENLRDITGTDEIVRGLIKNKGSVPKGSGGDNGS